MCEARRRLWLMLPVAPRRCPGRTCQAALDRFGHHLASCSRTGLLKRRSVPQERAWAQVFREAGARVVDNQRLRDMCLPGVGPRDDRKIEIVAYNLPLFHGVPLCCDATLVSTLDCKGRPKHRSDDLPGNALLEARKDKERTYPELRSGEHALLVVLGCEVGGRWSEEAVSTLRLLAEARARSAPRLLRGPLERAMVARWSAMVAVAVQDSLAATLCGAGQALHFPADRCPNWGDF